MNLANYLSKKCDYLVDWSRLGQLLFSWTHKYSIKEILIRLFVSTSTALSCWLFLHEFDYSIPKGLLGSLVGFTISHTIVILQLILKRLRVKRQCREMASAIINRLDEMDENKVISEDTYIDMMGRIRMILT